VSQQPFLSSRFWSRLTQLDRHAANEVRSRGCPHCGGVLHSARYSRKPRGLDRAVLGEHYRVRESFCCAACRRRTTPPSLRFLGRKVYLGALLILFGNLATGVEPSASSYRSLSARCGIPTRTLARWRRGWIESIPTTRWWRDLAPRFMPAIATDRLPLVLLERVRSADASTRLVRVLGLAGPLSTRTCSHFARVTLDPHKMS